MGTAEHRLQPGTRRAVGRPAATVGERLARGFRAVRRFAVDVADEVGQAGVAEVLADRGVR